MENEILSSIHFDFVQSEEYANSTEVKNMNDKSAENYKKIVAELNEETFRKIEGFIAEVNCECEYNGFLMGFKYAVKMMLECGLAVTMNNKNKEKGVSL